MMLCCSILCSFTCHSAFGDEAQLQQLREAEEVNAALRAEKCQLEKRLEALETELLALRSEYTALMLAQEETLTRNAAFSLAAGHLLRQNAEEELQSESVTLLETLGLVRRRAVKLQGRFRELRNAAENALAVSRSSGAVSQTVAESLAAVAEALDQCLEPLALVSEVEGSAAVNEATVLLVDSAAQIVILDCGVLNGVRNDHRFALRRDGKAVAVLAVVECRLLKSAACLVEGDFGSLVPGAMLVREKILLPKEAQPPVTGRRER